MPVPVICLSKAPPPLHRVDRFTNNNIHWKKTHKPPLFIIHIKIPSNQRTDQPPNCVCLYVCVYWVGNKKGNFTNKYWNRFKWRKKSSRSPPPFWIIVLCLFVVVVVVVVEQPKSSSSRSVCLSLPNNKQKYTEEKLYKYYSLYTCCLLLLFLTLSWRVSIAIVVFFFEKKTEHQSTLLPLRCGQ